MLDYVVHYKFLYVCMYVITDSRLGSNRLATVTARYISPSYNHCCRALHACQSPVMIESPDFFLTFPDILREHLLIIDPLNSSDVNKCN